MTTTVSQDEALQKSGEDRNQPRSTDILEAAKLMGPSGRGITALPSMSLNPGDAKASVETAGTNVTDEGKTKKRKRNSLIRFGRSFSINLPFGRKRRSATLDKDSQKKHKSDLDILDCFRAQPSTQLDQEGDFKDAADADDNSSLDPTTAFLTPATRPTTPEPMDTGKTKAKKFHETPKPRSHPVTPKTKPWSQKKLERMAKAKKVEKMQAEIMRLNAEVVRLEAEKELLRVSGEQYKADWYETSYMLTQEEYNHWETKCKRSREGVVGSEVPHLQKRARESAALRVGEDRMCMGHLLERDDGGGYEAGALSMDVEEMDAFLASGGDGELEDIGEMRNGFARPSNGSGVRQSWVTEGTGRTGGGVRDSWMTDWMPEGYEGGEDTDPGPETYRTRTSDEAIREV